MLDFLDRDCCVCVVSTSITQARCSRYLAEAALVLAVWSSARILAVLRLGFDVVLKPAQNKVPEEPCQ